MDSRPHLQALISALCGMEEKDEGFPLRILVNLHRVKLRAPLLNMIDQARRGASVDGAGMVSIWLVVSELESALSKRYPALDQGTIFDDERVAEYLKSPEPTWPTPENLDLDGAGLFLEIFHRQSLYLSPAEPVIRLYQLSLLDEDTRFQRMADKLEAQLALHEQVAQIVLDHAKSAR